MLAARRGAVTAGGAIGARPDQHVVERLSQHRLLAIDRGQQAATVVLTHVRVASVARRWDALLPADEIAVLRRPQFYCVVKRERAPHVRAGGSVIAEHGVNGAIVAR